jgi:hypothetical protein
MGEAQCQWQSGSTRKGILMDWNTCPGDIELGPALFRIGSLSGYLSPHLYPGHPEQASLYTNVTAIQLSRSVNDPSCEAGQGYVTANYIDSRMAPTTMPQSFMVMLRKGSAAHEYAVLLANSTRDLSNGGCPLLCRRCVAAALIGLSTVATLTNRAVS